MCMGVVLCMCQGEREIDRGDAIVDVKGSLGDKTCF